MNKENGIHLPSIHRTIDLHRTKLEKATEFYAKHAGTLLTPPTGDNMKLYPKLVKKTFTIKEKTDLVIAGLGWVTIQKPGYSICMESKRSRRDSTSIDYLKKGELSWN